MFKYKNLSYLQTDSIENIEFAMLSLKASYFLRFRQKNQQTKIIFYNDKNQRLGMIRQGFKNPMLVIF